MFALSLRKPLAESCPEWQIPPHKRACFEWCWSVISNSRYPAWHVKPSYRFLLYPWILSSSDNLDRYRIVAVMSSVLRIALFAFDWGLRCQITNGALGGGSVYPRIEAEDESGPASANQPSYPAKGIFWFSFSECQETSACAAILSLFPLSVDRAQLSFPHNIIPPS